MKFKNNKIYVKGFFYIMSLSTVVVKSVCSTLLKLEFIFRHLKIRVILIMSVFYGGCSQEFKIIILPTDKQHDTDIGK